MAFGRTPLRIARGVTLVELLSVVAVLGVVTAVAAPAMRSFGVSQRAKAVGYDLVSDLLVARSEALKRNRPVTVAPLGTDWTIGWTLTDGAQIITTRQTDAGSLAYDGAPAAITFNVFGRVSDPANQVRITVLPADSRSDAARRCIEVDPSGYARSKLGSCT
jgi:type IV fimbrial biogenesis protein FimT